MAAESQKLNNGRTIEITVTDFSDAKVDHNELSKVQTKKKKKRKNKSDLGENFQAPDGGWGWLICLGAGCANLCTFPVIQQFGLIFRDRLKALSITSSQMTTIINLNSAMTSIVGLANGPLFRRFSYRQVALFGSFLVAIALLFTSVANSFMTYVMTYSMLFGAGVGIVASANSLALNTYFMKKRRIATGLSWTATALGPIISPHIITSLLAYYGVQDTVLLFSGFALNAVACALLLQPVQWHVPPPSSGESEKANNELQEYECKFCETNKRKNPSLFSSQYLYNSDQPYITGYEIIDPIGTPMLSRANDGWFSGGPRHRNSLLQTSKLSLTANRFSKLDFDTKYSSNYNSTAVSTRPSYASLGTAAKDKLKNGNLSATSPFFFHSLNRPTNLQVRKRSNTFNLEKEVLRMASQKLEKYLFYKNNLAQCTCEEDLKAMEMERQIDDLLNDHNDQLGDDEAEEDDRPLSVWDKVVIFFDLTLLKDLIFVNLMVGVTIANFSELNFSTLTPFVLCDFGFTNYEIATVMSLLGLIDISARFLIPFIAGKIGWENRTFFLFGVLGMALGRIILAHFQSYETALYTACWMGFNRALRTVFMALVIPSHVPLNRLPAATGLQLLFSGCFYLCCGPVVGWIRDATNYSVTLHCLNITTYITAISWGLEKLYCTYKERAEEAEFQRQQMDVIKNDEFLDV